MSRTEFSERMGLKKVDDLKIQLNSMNRRLKSRLWNKVYSNVFMLDLGRYEYGGSKITYYVWEDYWANEITSLPKRKETILGDIKYEWDKMNWENTYNFIQFILRYPGTWVPMRDLIEDCNEVLAQEKAGYRIIDSVITPIIDDVEITSVEESLKNTDEFEVISEHIRTSMQFLSDRDNPNYRNSIKESISAVESMCKIITKKEKATLGDALKIIRKDHDIHPALFESFNKLYGYTNDENGIRHSLNDGGVKIQLTEAKFMLITCSAFVNFLKEKLVEK